ncbi:MAG: hypothetical protein OXI60_05710 [Acidiferrobacterales bacterium]|nr:hypothetical protein [Acidiferrobacterales bacterium]
MQRVTVIAPARLHLGFVGLNSSSAPELGALGVAIQRPSMTVRAQKSLRWNVSGSMQGEVRRCIDRLITAFELEQPLHFEVASTIPAHIGLGSGTQLALAVGVSIMRLNDISIPIARLSHLLRRGERSGIGTAAFLQGGFLVDTHASTKDEVRTIAHRLEFPANWRILLIFDDDYQGTHGDIETDAFCKLGGFSDSLTERLQRILLDQVLPALERGDVTDFGDGITTIQRHVGDFFSPIQGGRYLSPGVADVLSIAEKLGGVGVGQSSWGPTGFVILDTESSALELQTELLETRKSFGVRLEICKGRNEGAQIQVE